MKIKNYKEYSCRVFYTSDTHVGHWNINKYCNRGFTHLDQMDETIITNWNSRINKDDIVFHLGDFTFYKDKFKVASILHRLNGNIHLIMGNHDIRENFSECNFYSISDYKKISIDNRKIIMCHYPIESWDGMHYESIHLYGHTHERPNMLTMKKMKNRINVGVDMHSLYPLEHNEMLQYLEKWNSRIGSNF